MHFASSAEAHEHYAQKHLGDASATWTDSA